MQLSLKTYGETGILAYDLTEPEREGLRRALQINQPENCLEYIEGYDTLLFIFKQPTLIDKLSEWLAPLALAGAADSKSDLLEIPVRYNGPDLESVAEQAGLSVDQVVNIHSGAIYTVRMLGFSPGFPYLDGLDPRLHLARKDSPRTRIKPGAVAIGGSHAGIYSVASPGGWHLLGHTDFTLFDQGAAQTAAPIAADVFVLSPGDRLRFQPID